MKPEPTTRGKKSDKKKPLKDSDPSPPWGSLGKEIKTPLQWKKFFELLILSISICSSGTWQYYKFIGIFFKENTVESPIGFIFTYPCPYWLYLGDANPERDLLFWNLKTNQNKFSSFFQKKKKKKKVFQCMLIRLKLSPCVSSLNVSVFNCLRSWHLDATERNCGSVLPVSPTPFLVCSLK